MGVVYKAEDTKLKRIVALKFLPQAFSFDKEAKKRFINEAQTASSLQQHNICTIHDIDETKDGQIFICMDLYEGKTLKEKIESEQIKTDEAMDIIIQVATGLQKAHEKGIVHRDIKPANIFVTNDGVVKILDFGLAKSRRQTQLTQMESTLGTIDYMSPEQANGNSVDKRTDIWSVGVVLYEMLTGRRPFAAEYEQAVIYSILNKEPQAISEIDGRLQQIINKALAKNPDNRFQSAGEIIEELKKIKSGQGVKRTKKKQKLPLIISAAVVVIIAVAIYFLIPSSKSIEETETIKTIAVLPFVDMSPNKDQEYFSDGVSEELINTLSKNPKLRVTARTSSFYFKGTKTNIKTIAQTLGVKHILEGSVRKSGDNLRISANLVNAETDAMLWSDTYNGTMKNIFALQDSISGSVADALDAVLKVNNAKEPEKKTNPDAYNAFLLGNHFYDLAGKEDFERAINYYEQALVIDSNYAPAWVGLSKVHFSQGYMGYLSGSEMINCYSKARSEAQKALLLNPNLVEAYEVIGWIKMGYDWDWASSNDFIKKALQLGPGKASVIGSAASLAATLGQFNEAVTLLKRSIDIDPVRPLGYLNLGIAYYYSDLTDSSLTTLRKSLELKPNYQFAQVNIGLVYLEQGKTDSAFAEFNKISSSFWQKFGLALVYYALGRMNEADDKLGELIKNNARTAAFQIAEIYAYRKEKDKAFNWLERAYNQRDGGLTQIKGDPLLRNIEQDSRYAEFLKKMKLPL